MKRVAHLSDVISQESGVCRHNQFLSRAFVWVNVSYCLWPIYCINDKLRSQHEDCLWLLGLPLRLCRIPSPSIFSLPNPDWCWGCWGWYGCHPIVAALFQNHTTATCQTLLPDVRICKFSDEALCLWQFKMDQMVKVTAAAGRRSQSRPYRARLLQQQENKLLSCMSSSSSAWSSCILRRWSSCFIQGFRSRCCFGYLRSN